MEIKELDTNEDTLILRNEARDMLQINHPTLLNFIKKGRLKVDKKTKKIYISSIIPLKKELEERRNLSVNWLVSHHAN